MSTVEAERGQGGVEGRDLARNPPKDSGGASLHNPHKKVKAILAEFCKSFTRKLKLYFLHYQCLAIFKEQVADRLS